MAAPLYAVPGAMGRLSDDKHLRGLVLPFPDAPFLQIRKVRLEGRHLIEHAKPSAHCSGNCFRMERRTIISDQKMLQLSRPRLRPRLPGLQALFSPSSHGKNKRQSIAPSAGFNRWLLSRIRQLSCESSSFQALEHNSFDLYGCYADIVMKSLLCRHCCAVSLLQSLYCSHCYAETFCRHCYECSMPRSAAFSACAAVRAEFLSVCSCQGSSIPRVCTGADLFQCGEQLPCSVKKYISETKFKK